MARSDFLAIFGEEFSVTSAKAHRDAQSRLRDCWRQKVSYGNCHQLLRQSLVIIDDASRRRARTRTPIDTAILSSHIPRDKVHLALTLWLKSVGFTFLGLPGPAFQPAPGEPDAPAYLDHLRDCGLFQSGAQTAIAKASESLLDRLVGDLCRSRPWQRSVGEELMMRVRTDFAQLMQLFSKACKRGEEPLVAQEVDWESLAVKKLGEHRSRDFFAMVEQRGLSMEDCEGALTDLKICLQQPEHRGFLQDDFTMRLERDLLQPGRSTVDILDIFVRAVHRLKYIDPYGSLLNEIGKRFREHIRLREDAVRIMLINFLEGCRHDSKQRSSAEADFEDFSTNIANSVRTESSNYAGDFYEGQDLTDMKWQPEPVDASAGHQETRKLDDLGHLIKLAEQQTFVTDLQLLYRARLLGSATSDYVQEMDLLGLLKRRFDQDSAFQNVEVMLNDVLSSHRVLTDMLDSYKKAQQNDLSLGPHAAASAAQESPIFPLDFSTRILSRAYWNKVDPEDFQLPEVMEATASAFSAHYKAMKRERYLDWSKQLGHTTLELSFDDGRTFTGEVTTAQATVIHAFEATPTASISSIASATHMDPVLVRASIAFWISQQVLAQSTASDPDTYTIIEHLASPSATSPEPGTTTPSASAALASATQATEESTSLKSAADLLRDNGVMYGNFITALLTNQGGMPAVRIHSILGIMMPGGFPFEMGDLIGFLRDMAEEAKVENTGGVWRVRR